MKYHTLKSAILHDLTSLQTKREYIYVYRFLYGFPEYFVFLLDERVFFHEFVQFFPGGREDELDI